MAGAGPKILFLNHNLSGQATYFRNRWFAKGLANRGWQPTLLTVSPARRLAARRMSDEGVRIIETPWFLSSAFWAGNGFDPLDILHRCVWTACHRFDVTVVSDHLLNVSLPYFTSRLLRRSGIYLADWADLFGRGGCHAAFRHGWKKPFHAVSEWLEFSTKRQCDLASAISHPLHRLLITDCGKPPERTIFLPVGCDSRVPCEDSVQPARERLGFHTPGLIVGRTGRSGQAARLHPHEQRAFLAIHRFLLQRDCPPPMLYLVGDHREDWYPELKESGCQIRISGLLPSAEVPRHLSACDLFMLLEADTPFYRYRWPTRLSDYLLTGRPILCNSVGDPSELLVSSGAGALWDDLEHLPEPVQGVLLNPAARQRMGRNARGLAEGQLSWPRLTELLEAFIFLHHPHLRAGSGSASGQGN